MSEPATLTPATAPDATPAPSRPASAGALLRQAREAAGLHVAALAVAMKVPVKKLEALEADRLDLLPDAVFVRALASSMCRALKIDTGPVLALLPQTAVPRLDTEERGINAPFHTSHRSTRASIPDFLGKPVVWLVAVLLAGAAVLIAFPEVQRMEKVDRDSDVAPQGVMLPAQPMAASDAQPLESQPPEPVPAPARVSSPEPAGASATNTLVPTSPVAPPLQVASAPTPKPVPTSATAAAPAANAHPAAVAQVAPTPTRASSAATPNQVAAPRAASAPVPLAAAAVRPASTPANTPASTAPKLNASAAPVDLAGATTGLVVFKVHGTSWVEVTDAKGVVQLRKTLATGETSAASGALPLSVVVGRADVTAVEVRGKPFALAATTKDNVARFEVK